MESHADVTLRGSHCLWMGDWGSLRVRSDPADSHLVRTGTGCASMEVALGRRCLLCVAV